MIVQMPGESEVNTLDAGAAFSPCRTYRYLLWRRWDPQRGTCAFVGLNPSTADEMTDDPTVRRCIRFAMDWGYGALWMLNAYSFRATNPQVMKGQGTKAVGPLNDAYLEQAARTCDLVVAAWGTHCDRRREHEIRIIFRQAQQPLSILGLTNGGHPRHPLYLRADLRPREWV